MNSLDFNALFDALARAFGGASGAGALSLFLHAVDWFRPYSTILSLLFLTGIAYCFLRIQHIMEETAHRDHHPEGESSHAPEAPAPGGATAKRWERVLRHLESSHESDWRLAILEADVLLSELVDTMGYHGDSLGEKLKAIEQSDFTTLPKAWEAHGVRNRIAHEGAAFALTEREAKRVIALYEEVFSEFQYI